MLSGLRGWEWLIILLLVVLLFGAKKLPETARGIGRSLRIFKAETKGMRDDDDSEIASPTPEPTPSQQIAPAPQPTTVQPTTVQPTSAQPAPVAQPVTPVERPYEPTDGR